MRAGLLLGDSDVDCGMVAVRAYIRLHKIVILWRILRIIFDVAQLMLQILVCLESFREREKKV